MHLRLKVALVGVMLSSAVLVSQQPTAPRVPASKGGSHPAGVSARPGKTAEIKSIISGTAVDSTATPLPNVAIRLRNLDTNKIEQTTVTNVRGEFTFITTPETPYVVEIAHRSGRVIAVSDVVVVQPGEVAGTVVAAPSRLPALAGLFGDTASSIISAATGTGLTVVDPTLPKSSPSR